MPPRAPSDAPRQLGQPIRDPCRGRPHRKLRISVTDRCAFRCTYCVPDEPTALLPRKSILRFEEIQRFVREAAVPLGLVDLRITGGEPLQRRNLPTLLRMLHSTPGIRRVGLTTNGERLRPLAAELCAAGLDALNISLDTLRRDRFRDLVRLDRLEAVLDGVAAAAALPFPERKINCVPIRGFNEDEIGDLLAFGLDHGFDVRFIEFMPFGSRWRASQVVTADEIVETVAKRFGPVEPEMHRSGETARIYRLRGSGGFGIIPTLSEPFCGHCNRVRLTADGRLLPCLFATEGADLRSLLRADAPAGELQAAVARSLRLKGGGYLATMRDRLAVAVEGRARSMRGIGG